MSEEDCSCHDLQARREHNSHRRSIVSWLWTLALLSGAGAVWFVSDDMPPWLNWTLIAVIGAWLFTPPVRKIYRERFK